MTNTARLGWGIVASLIIGSTLLFVATKARAEIAEITMCRNEATIQTYIRYSYMSEDPSASDMLEMKKQCLHGVAVFNENEVVRSFDFKGYTYTVVRVAIAAQVVDGVGFRFTPPLMQYAFRFAKATGKDA